ncbi:MAG: hypothetical protein CMA63_07240 [Euryarchaeota archaeon]|nr:hypothetical protein [Euryarchaeota archaeon]
MESSPKWHGRLESLNPKEQDTLLGTSLSRRFTQLPLWLSHPSNISAFYGFLVALALLLPYRFAQVDDRWFANWAFHGTLIMLSCLLLGMVSLVIVGISKRLPVAPPRFLLYPMPFVGLACLTVSGTDLLTVPAGLTWFLLLLPGPMYVHLSWAPRWRLLCMLDDGVNPFEGMESTVSDIETGAESIAGTDEELLSVVDSFEEE